VIPEPIAVTLLVIEALDDLGVPYLIGGSLASAVYGVPRATMDADLVADLRLEHAEQLARSLGNAFYLEIESIREAIDRHSSFNVIHMETMFKLDIFVPKRRPFDAAQLARRRPVVVAADPERTAYFASAEDSILTKLEWYRVGGQVSERQWRDVMGILKAQSNRLDLAYMRQWAVPLNVADLLEQALGEAGAAP
jgi:hypothetical protein